MTGLLKMRFFKVFITILQLSFCLPVFSAETAEKKVIKEEELGSFTKDAKFSGEDVDQAKIDKEMAVLDEKGKEKSFDYIMLLDECSKLSDQKAYSACKQKIISNK